MLDVLLRAALPSTGKALSASLRKSPSPRSATMASSKQLGIALSAVLMVVALSSVPNQASAAPAQIVADLGAGWNLGNQMEANANGVPSETAWGQPTITQALIDKVKAAGFKTVRIPVSYLSHIGA